MTALKVVTSSPLIFVTARGSSVLETLQAGDERRWISAQLRKRAGMTKNSCRMTPANRIVAAWYAPRLTPLTAVLVPLSIVFRAMVALRRAFHRNGALHARLPPVPIVVVGNITVGGSGKTPLVIALASALAGRGWMPGIVSGGYGGATRGPRAVVPDSPPAEVGDEPILLARTGFPVWVGRDRPAAVHALLAAHPECNVVIAD